MENHEVMILNLWKDEQPPIKVITSNKISTTIVLLENKRKDRKLISPNKINFAFSMQSIFMWTPFLRTKEVATTTSHLSTYTVSMLIEE